MSPTLYAASPQVWYNQVDINDYDHVDPKNLIPSEAKKKALAYFELYKNKIPNKNYLTVFDASSISAQPRFFLINLNTGAVETFLVAHGKGSDQDHDGYAESFSNVNGSNATSLGFYFTDVTYYGEHGYSLRLKGLESTNSNAYQRAIVVHGADYVNPAIAKTQNKIGRSQGCPALENRFAKPIIDKIKNGSVLYIWKS